MSAESKFLVELIRLIDHHKDRCEPYKLFLESIGWKTADSIAELPFLPVRIFKELELLSIERGDVFRTLTSSGTTGSAVSKIFLDAESASLQSRRMIETMGTVVGKSRLPMLVVDSKSVALGKTYSARGAGVLGMMNLGRRHRFVLDDRMQVDDVAISEFCESVDGKPFLVFGFTYMVWMYLASLKLSDKWDLSHGVVIHSGGWKKLQDQSVDNATFREVLKNNLGVSLIYNFYGMVEQIGTIYLESDCGDGYFTCPPFADVLIRDPITFSVMPDGEVGLIQTISLLPTSYPGNSILTEDLGFIDLELDPIRNVKRFRVLGRLPRAEVRGCSDTFVQP